MVTLVMVTTHDGSRWCIGPGNSTHILDEPWLLNGECIDGSITGVHFVCDLISEARF